MSGMSCAYDVYFVITWSGPPAVLPVVWVTRVSRVVPASAVVDDAVNLVRAVRKPGAYPVADGVTLDSLLAVAGGLGQVRQPVVGLEPDSVRIHQADNGDRNRKEARSERCDAIKRSVRWRIKDIVAAQGRNTALFGRQLKCSFHAVFPGILSQGSTLVR